jgi:hypothetical protein
MAEASIINLEARRNLRADASLSTGPVRSGEGSSAIRPSTTPPEATIEDLYGSDTGATRLFARARQILRDGDERIGRALILLGGKDVVGADNEVNLFQAQLPELFLCKAVSEGLAAGTVAMFHALQNRGGSLIETDQLWALRQLIRRLLEETFVQIEDIVDEIAALTDAGLAVGPKDAEVLEDIFAPE